jgi:hypothetical protein
LTPSNSSPAAEIASSRYALLAMTASTATSLRAKRSNLASLASADVWFCNFDTILSPYIYRAEGERCRAAHPGGLSCQIVGFEPFAIPKEGSGAPKFAGAERRTRWPVLRSDLSLQREGTASP